VYEPSEIGRLQTSFNRMVAELAERERLRDLFGRLSAPMSHSTRSNRMPRYRAIYAKSGFCSLTVDGNSVGPGNIGERSRVVTGLGQ
jgi:hypothetical protein